MWRKRVMLICALLMIYLSCGWHEWSEGHDSGFTITYSTGKEFHRDGYFREYVDRVEFYNPGQDGIPQWETRYLHEGDKLTIW